MSTRKWVSALAITGIAGGVYFLAHTRTGASQPPAEDTPPARWDTTTMGTPLPWPAGFDPNRVACPPHYSPSGRYVDIVTADTGTRLILDTQTGILHELYEHVARDHVNLGCQELFWLSDERILLNESWAADSDRAAVREYLADENNPYMPGMLFQGTKWRTRIVDWLSGSTEWESPAADHLDDRAHILGLDGAGRWITYMPSADDTERCCRIYDPRTATDAGVALTWSPEESVRWGPRGSWLVKVGLPASVVTLSRTPLNLVLVNYQTGETRTLSNVPPFSDWVAPPFTNDGRYMLVARPDYEHGRSVPIVLDAVTGTHRELPATESWLPVDINETRGVVLVYMARCHLTGPNGNEFSWTNDWAEIPLSAVLAE